MDAYHITFMFPQPGVITVVADSEEAAKNKLVEMLGASDTNMVTNVTITNYRDVPALMTALAENKKNEEAMIKEYQRIIAEHEAKEAAEDAKKDNVVDLAEVRERNNPETIN